MRSVGEITPSSENISDACGLAMMLTPPARATSHSPSRSARTAWWVDTNDAEQAVSTLTEGPRKSKA